MGYRFFWLISTPHGMKSWDGETPPPAHVLKRMGATKARCIESPDDDTRTEGRLITDAMRTAKIWSSAYAHAYRPGRSIVTNALPHVGKPYMLSMDVVECYDHVTPGMVGREIAYRRNQPGQGAPKPDEDLFDRLIKWCFIHTDRVERTHLPTGHPESPYLLNVAMRAIDYKIMKLIGNRTRRRRPSRHRGWGVGPEVPDAGWFPIAYTRYSDNLTFSSHDARVLTLDHAVTAILAADGLKVNPKKTRRLGPGVPHKVCGVVVNEKLSVGRSRLRRTRARVNNVLNRIKAGDEVDRAEVDSVRGDVSFVWSVNKEQGAPLIRELSKVNLWRLPQASQASFSST